MLVEFLHTHLFLQFIEGACQLILHTDIHSIRSTTVILQGNNALRHQNDNSHFIQADKRGLTSIPLNTWMFVQKRDVCIGNIGSTDVVQAEIDLAGFVVVGCLVLVTASVIYRCCIENEVRAFCRNDLNLSFVTVMVLFSDS